MSVRLTEAGLTTQASVVWLVESRGTSQVFFFFFILILCEVTSYRQTTEDLDTVLTCFKRVAANNHLHGLLISNFTSRYTQV